MPAVFFFNEQTLKTFCVLNNSSDKRVMVDTTSDCTPLSSEGHIIENNTENK